MRELVLGCGHKKTKSLYQKNIVTIEGQDESILKEYKNPYRVDINPDVNPDLVYDLNQLPYPFEDDEFDEIHAYEILEHLGTQGDYKFFFAQFDELARCLKHNGMMMISVPKWNKVWCWGDPGHTRCLPPEIFQFLDRNKLAEEASRTAMTDYRSCFTSNWVIAHVGEINEYSLGIVLVNVKEDESGSSETESLPV